MTRNPIHRENQLIEFEALPIQSVSLEPEHFDQSVEISDRVITEPRQWQTYLNALALFGFREWFSEQAPDLDLDWKKCSVLKPQYANVIEAVCHIRGGEFKLCLIATGGAIEPFIQLPRAVIDLPEFAAHFYIVVRVMEEQEQAQVWSFLRYDQWIAHQQSQPLQPEPNWSYQVPAEWFDRNLNRLLLHLRCLEPDAIALPQAATDQANKLTKLQHEVLQQFSHAKSVETPLWQLMTWERGVEILTNPALLDWLYQVQTGQIATASLAVEAPPQPLLKPVLNAGRWLQNELDEMAQALGWMLLPPFAELRSLREERTEMRSPDAQSTIKEIEFIRKQLQRDDTTIPSDARCVYKDLSLSEIPLRLYAVAWELDSPKYSPEKWTLLLILKRQADCSTGHTMKLSVKDQIKLLDEQTLEPDAETNYLYAHVIGDWNEEFLVTIALDNSTTITLPPFVFYLGE